MGVVFTILFVALGALAYTLHKVIAAAIIAVGIVAGSFANAEEVPPGPPDARPNPCTVGPWPCDPGTLPRLPVTFLDFPACEPASPLNSGRRSCHDV